MEIGQFRTMYDKNGVLVGIFENLATLVKIIVKHNNY